MAQPLARVLLTGSEGRVGRVLTGRASRTADLAAAGLCADITCVDKSMVGAAGGHGTSLAGENQETKYQHFVELDLIREPERFGELLSAHRVLIHAAWASEGIVRPDVRDPANLAMVQHVLQVVADLPTQSRPRLVFLSSVNANVPSDWIERRARNAMISVHEVPIPHHHNRGAKPSGVSGYALSKIEMETAVKEGVSDLDLDATIIRLGGVNIADTRPSQLESFRRLAESYEGRYVDLRWEDAVFLHHAELLAALQDLVDGDYRGGLKMFNLVSDSDRRVHVLQPTASA